MDVKISRVYKNWSVGNNFWYRGSFIRGTGTYHGMWCVHYSDGSLNYRGSFKQNIRVGFQIFGKGSIV